jgi:CMP-N-acetylneuraminic acid synthetase
MAEPSGVSGRPLAVIPARCGSKRLPGKNIRLFDGRPLISRTISRVLATALFQAVLVTTDSPEIAEIARNAGAWVPFLRPPELSDDDASSLDVLLHAVEQTAQREPTWNPPFIALFQPTSPFLASHHITEAVRQFQTEGVKTLSSMCLVAEHPAWMFRRTAQNHGEPLHPEEFFQPGHALPRLYRENGALYFVSSGYLREKKSLYDLTAHGMYLMTVPDSVDIDTQSDWDYAEFMLRKTTCVNAVEPSESN